MAHGTVEALRATLFTKKGTFFMGGIPESIENIYIITDKKIKIMNAYIEIRKVGI